MQARELESNVTRGAPGDPIVLDDVYREFHGRVLGLCRRLLGHAANAEDAAAEVFARLPDALASYDRRRPLSSWLLGVAANHCIDRLRRSSREARIFVDEAPEPIASNDPLSTLLDREARERLSAAIDALPDKYRVPLVLRFQAEQSYAQIARALDVQVGQVASLLSRARARLRAALGDAAEGSP